MMIRLPLCAGLALACFISPAGADEIRIVDSEPSLSRDLPPMAAWKAASLPDAQRSHLRLPAPDDGLIDEMVARNIRAQGAPQIGINRANDIAPAPALSWHAVPGGRVARVEVASTGALGLRTALAMEGLPNGLQLRFAGNLDPAAVHRVDAEDARAQLSHGVYWSPVTDGDVQSIELFAPEGIDVSRVALGLPQLSHLLTNSAEGFSMAKALGDSGACQSNVACYLGSLGNGYALVRNAVSMMVFTKPTGTHTCTGTLLNDSVTATQVPYLLTAHHCIANQAEASSLTTHWGYESATCGGTTSAAVAQLGGGATYLYSSANSDIALLRLNAQPGGYAVYAGWDANPVANGTNVTAVHHPRSDIKKASFGRKTAEEPLAHIVGWLAGTLEPGSSGSALLTQGTGGHFYARGTAWQGRMSCANTGNLSHPDNFVVYSRLDAEYNNVKGWLAPSVQAPGPTAGRDYTGPWNVPAEAGWGLTMFQFDPPANYLFALIFIYDDTGTAKWYEYSGVWTGTDISSGNVLESTAAPWATTYNPANRAFTPAGTATLTFTSATTANITFTVEGVTRSAAIQLIQ